MIPRRRLVKRPVLDYTFFMLLAYSIVLTSLVAQAEPDIPGTNPYVFVMRQGDSTETYHVLVEDKELAKEHAPFLAAHRDEPWLPIDQRRESIRRDDIVENYKEASTQRKRRLNEGWKAHGGIEVDTPAGKKWVFSDDYNFAKRATELATSANVTSRAQSDTGSKPEVAALSNSPGLFQQWWLHGVIVLATIVIGAGVIFTTMVRAPWSTLRS